MTFEYFQSYTNSLLATNVDTIFNRNYLLYYVNTVDKVNTNLSFYRNELQTAKSILYTKCRTFISGLHILAENKIPESILHANVFANILHIITEQLKVRNQYTLLYGSSVNPYYNMKIVKSFIINNVLYLNIMLPLQHNKAPTTKLYKLQSHYLPTNMSTICSQINSYTKLGIDYPYIAFNKYRYPTLDIDFDKDTIQFDNLHVPTSALLMFNHQEDNCYLNILGHVSTEIITSTYTFQFYRNLSVKPSLVTTNAYYYLMNVFSLISITCEVDMAVTEKISFAVTIVN